MASSALLCLFVILLLYDLQNTRSKSVCDVTSCGEIDIQFPFGLKGSRNQDPECSSYYYYPNPSFLLSCNNRSQTILTLPNSGDLIVKNIDYERQTLQVNDPDGCLPKPFLQRDWNLTGSPFLLNPSLYQNYNLTFLNCPSNFTKSNGLPSISCLSAVSNYSSVIVSWPHPIGLESWSSCEVISTAIVPLPIADMPQWPFWPDLTADVGLMWAQPRCWVCAVSGQLCGFASNHDNQLACFSTPNTKTRGLPRRAKYGLILGVGVPGLLCIIGLGCFICGKVKVNMHRRRPITDLPTTTISLQPSPLVTGLDSATIEKYPKTLLGESGRLLKPSDNTCSICLSEYEPKETLRTIPECNHYFHAHCIDEWLRMNGTCPLCRKTPGSSSSKVTPSFSSSLSPSP